MLKLLEKNIDHHFCYNNFVVDTYEQCMFQCTYCYAGRQKCENFFIEEIEKTFVEVFEQKKKNQWTPILTKRIPLRIGFLSDPFPNQELEEGKTTALLNLLKKYDYPYYIVTKSSLTCAENIIDRNLSEIHLSFSTISENLRQKIEAGTSAIEKRVACLDNFVKRNFSVTVRLSLLPPALVVKELQGMTRDQYLDQLIDFFIRRGVKKFILNEIVAHDVSLDWYECFHLSPEDLKRVQLKYGENISFSVCYLGSHFRQFFVFGNHLQNCCRPTFEHSTTKSLSFFGIIANEKFSPKFIFQYLRLKVFTWFIRKIYQ